MTQMALIPTQIRRVQHFCEDRRNVQAPNTQHDLDGGTGLIQPNLSVSERCLSRSSIRC